MLPAKNSAARLSLSLPFRVKPITGVAPAWVKVPAVPVVRPRITETTALGAAYLAGLATGFWRDEAQIAAMWSRERAFEPQLSRDEASSRLAEWRRAVERSRDWVRD